MSRPAGFLRRPLGLVGGLRGPLAARRRAAESMTHAIISHSRLLQVVEPLAQPQDLLLVAADVRAQVPLDRGELLLGVDAPRRFLKSSTAVGEKRASDDLRDVVKNYDEIHEWLAPKGVLASPCLLKMLEVRGPQVFEPCPAPALVARTVTSLSPAKTCPGPRGGGTSGDPLSHQRTKRHDGRRAYFDTPATDRARMTLLSGGSQR